MELSFETVALLILVVCAVGATLLRFGLPYSVGMAAIALGLALSPLSSSSGIGFTQVAYTALIPPLVFTAAFSLDWHKLRRELGHPSVSLLSCNLGVSLNRQRLRP